jgi:hypothetical protein
MHDRLAPQWDLHAVEGGHAWLMLRPWLQAEEPSCDGLR